LWARAATALDADGRISEATGAIELLVNITGSFVLLETLAFQGFEPLSAVDRRTAADGAIFALNNGQPDG